MKNIREWILGGLVAILAPVCAYLSIHLISSNDTSIAALNTSIATTNDSITKLSDKFDNIANELGANKTAVAVLNNAGDQLRDDIHQTSMDVKENGRKLEALTKDVGFVQGQLSDLQGQVKVIAPSPK